MECPPDMAEMRWKCLEESKLMGVWRGRNSRSGMNCWYTFPNFNSLLLKTAVLAELFPNIFPSGPSCKDCLTKSIWTFSKAWNIAAWAQEANFPIDNLHATCENKPKEYPQQQWHDGSSFSADWVVLLRHVNNSRNFLNPNRGHDITNTNFMHYYEGNPSKSPCICIGWSPHKWVISLPLTNETWKYVKKSWSLETVKQLWDSDDFSCWVSPHFSCTKTFPTQMPWSYPASAWYCRTSRPVRSRVKFLKLAVLANVHVHHGHQTGRKHANLKGVWGKRRHLSTPFCCQRHSRLNMIREPVKNNLWWLLRNFMFSKFCGQLTVLLDYLRYLFSQSLTFGSLKKCAQSRSVPECFQVTAW